MKSLILILILLLGGKAIAQNAPLLHWLSIETNTTPLLFGGYAIGVNISPKKFKHWSLLVGQAGNADFPDWVVSVFRLQNNGKGINWTVSRAQVISLDYHFIRAKKGWYIGQFNFFFKNQLTKDNETRELTTHIPMLRTGYK